MNLKKRIQRNKYLIQQDMNKQIWRNESEETNLKKHIWSNEYEELFVHTDLAVTAGHLSFKSTFACSLLSAQFRMHNISTTAKLNKQITNLNKQIWTSECK